MTMRCAFGKRSLANQIGGQCAGPRGRTRHTRMCFISSYRLFSSNLFSCCPSTCCPCPFCLCPFCLCFVYFVFVHFVLRHAVLGHRVLFHVIGGEGGGRERYGQTERSGSKSLDRDGTGHCLILLRMSMVLIAPPPSNSIRYRPRLHQPAPSWTASTWGMCQVHNPPAMEPPRGRMNEMKLRERPPASPPNDGRVL